MSTFIFGHKNPDTDSVCSSIAYSYYKKQMNEDVEPRILGNLRKEAEFVLDYFKVPKPKLLENVKVQAKDLHYNKINPLTTSSSLYETYITMAEENIHTLPIVDYEQKLIGIVSMRDIARALIDISNNYVDTNLKSIMRVFEKYSPKINKDYDDSVHIKGNLKVFNPNVPKDFDFTKDEVIVVKEYHKDEFFKKLHFPLPLIILPQFHNLTKEEKSIIEKYDITVISVELNAPMIIKKMQQTDSIERIMKKDNMKKFVLNDYLEDIKDSMLKTNYRNYPLIDENGKYIGLIGRRHLLAPGRKKVIMVDHNEFSQSAVGIEEANILEIVDHHKIGGITTKEPIQFLNMIVGSTCTIVYELFKNSNIDIPYEIAGCLISGILSDTLHFKSPTCTKKDINAVNELNKILKLNLDEYTYSLFKAGSSIKDMSFKDILYNDFKEFTIKGKSVAISQIFTMDIQELNEKKEQLLEYMENIYKINSYNILLFAVTHTAKEGSYIYYKADDFTIIKRTFDIENQGDFVDMIVSRKKQILPKLSTVLEETY